MSEEPSAPNSFAQERKTSLRANFRYVYFAAVGSVVIGVTFPVLLACWHNWKEVAKNLGDDPYQEKVPSIIESVGSLELLATALCGPGAIVLSALLFKYLSHGKEKHSANSLVKTGLCGGAAISFFNFPGFLAGVVLGDHGVMIFVRIFLLFVVAGASCGAWTGWHVYRSADPGAPFWPRYGLSTLLGLVFAWAVLLAIFAPSSQS